MFKQDLLRKYPELTANKLRFLLNVQYFEELSKIGYKKTDKFLSPNVVRCFIELFGKPITDIDLIEDDY